MSGTTSGVEFTNSGNDTHMRIFRGNTITFEVIWGGDTPIDITGYLVILQLRDLKSNLLHEMSTTNGKINMGGIDGKMTFTDTEEDSRAVTAIGV